MKNSGTAWPRPSSRCPGTRPTAPGDPPQLVSGAGGAKRERGFVERARGADDFFRRGRTGTWREELTPRQVEITLAHHRLSPTTGR